MTQTTKGGNMAEGIDTLRAARKARGWSQEDLAQKSGIARETLSRFESGERTPSNAQTFVLAGLFLVHVSEVVRWGENVAGISTESEATS